MAGELDSGRRGRNPARKRRPPRRASRLTRTLLRWLRPPRTLRPTRAGWIFFGLTLAVGFAALNTGNNLLYLVLSLMLAFLVLSGVLSEAALRGVSVQRSLPREIFAGTPTWVALQVANGQRRVPSFAVAVEDRVCEGEDLERPAGRAFVLRVGPRQSERRTYRFRASQRGPVRFTGFKVSTRFPFGLFVKSLSVEDRVDALVYPQLDPEALPPDLGGEGQQGDSPSARPGPGSEVAGLRDYASGDSARRIQWRSSLRSGSLVVRDTEKEQQRELEIRLETRGQQPGERFEGAVRRAASAVVAALEAGIHVALCTEDARIPARPGSRQRTQLLAFLARVQPHSAGGEGISS
jgi:uncharacterized protein (DUF58 family)